MIGIATLCGTLEIPGNTTSLRGLVGEGWFLDFDREIRAHFNYDPVLQYNIIITGCLTKELASKLGGKLPGHCRINLKKASTVYIQVPWLEEEFAKVNCWVSATIGWRGNIYNKSLYFLVIEDKTQRVILSKDFGARYIKEMRGSYLILRHPFDGTDEVPVRSAPYGTETLREKYVTINDIVRFHNRNKK